MGGLDSPGFAQFKKLFKEGFEAARKHSDSILSELQCEKEAGTALKYSASLPAQRSLN
jgi:hypothetical protein